MSKARKAVIITTIILMVASVAAFIAAGVFQKRGSPDLGTVVELENAPDLTEGEKITFSVEPKELSAYNDDMYYIHYTLNEDGMAKGDYIIYLVKGYKKGAISSVQSDENAIAGKSKTAITLTGTLIATTEQDKNELYDYHKDLIAKVLPYLQNLYDTGDYKKEEYKESYPDEKTILEKLDKIKLNASEERLEAYRANISPLTIQLETGINMSTVKIGAAGAGALCLLVLIYALLGIRFSAGKLALGTGGAVIAAVAAAAFIMRGDISTMMSVKTYCPGLSMARIDNSYKLDKVLEYQPTNESEMLNAMSKELFFGYPLKTDISGIGCSAFSAKTAEGAHLLGRNFDLGDTDGTIIYTSPENGYRAIGVCDMKVVCLAGEQRIADVDSLVGRAMSRAFPYVTFDGMNEKGLGIGILSLDDDQQHPDTEKPDIYMLLAIRTILDTCANVDEAMQFLDSHDVHSMALYNYHLFIADKSGRSAVAEWVDGEFHVIETDHVTNYYLSGSKQDFSCKRYQTLEKKLDSTNGVLTVDEAMSLLSDVKQETTQWSCVYDLDNFKVYIVADMDWEHVYEITPESFE